MKKIYDVVVAGELNVDLILNRIDKIPEVGKEVLAEQMTVTLGSSSAIFASNLSVLGSKVTFAGTLDRDNFGEYILSSLRSKSVHTDHVVYTPGKGTGATIVLNFGEDRAMVTYPGAMSLLTLENISEQLLRESRHLHVSSVFLLTGLSKDILKLFKKAKSLGLTTSLDPQWDPNELWDIDFRALLPYVDVFMPNEREIKALTAEESVEKAVQSLEGCVNILVIKNGKDGAFLWRGGQFIHQPAFLNRNVADAIGSGDSFNAGFIHKFLQQKTLKECMEFAALTGAVNTTRAGGTAAFETFDLVRSIAKSSFNYIL